MLVLLAAYAVAFVDRQILTLLVEPVRRDLAFVVDRAMPAQELVDSVMADRPPFVEGFDVFDSYVGSGIESGKKSLAFRVLLQDTRKTLTDVEVDSSIARLVEIIATRHDGRLRQ